MDRNEFRSALDSYCSITRGSVTSYGRTEHHNKAIGGVKHSAHRYWVGADIVYDDVVDLETAIQTAARCGLKLIREDDHDHLQPLGWVAG